MDMDHLDKKNQEELESSRKENFRGKTDKIKCICVKESWGKDKVIFLVCKSLLGRGKDHIVCLFQWG